MTQTVFRRLNERRQIVRMVNFGLSALRIIRMHSGVTLAPIIGKVVPEELLTGSAIEMLTPFRPTRFN